MVAGSAAAKGNNALGISGVVWDAELKVCKMSDGGAVGIYVSGTLDCYALCREAGANVIVASYGGGQFSSFEREAIAALGTAGALFVASAGNGALQQLCAGSSWRGGRPRCGTACAPRNDSSLAAAAASVGTHSRCSPPLLLQTE